MKGSETKFTQTAVLPGRPPGWLRYTVALAAFGLALAIRLALVPWLPDRYPFAVFYIAVTVAAWFGGRGPALLTLALGLLAGDYFFVPPLNTFIFSAPHPTDVVGVVLYLFVSLTITFLVHHLRKARCQAEASAREAQRKQRELEQEISERQQAEGALRHSEERFRQVAEALRESRQMLRGVLDTIPVRAFWKDRNSVYLGCNEHFAHDAGLGSPDQIIGQDDFAMAWREQAPLYRADDQQVMRTGQAMLNYEEPQTAPDGRRLWLRTSKIPLRDATGKIVGVLGTYEDITERKQWEQALQASEEKFRALFDSAKDAILILDQEGHFLDVNREACERLGYTHDELLHMDVRGIDSPEFAALVPERLGEILRQGHFLFESEHQRRDGTIIPVEISSRLIELGGQSLMFSICRDITERKRAEENLARQKDRLELLSEAAAYLLFTEEPATAIGQLFHKLGQLFGLDVYFNYLVDEQGDALWLHSYAGVAPEVAQGISRLELGQAVCGTVALTHQAMAVANLPQCADPKVDLVKRLGLRAYVCHPLMVEKRLLGTLSFGSRTKAEFGEEELEFYRILCGYISIALDRWRLLQEVKQHAADLEERVAERTASLEQTIGSLESVLYHLVHDLRAPLRAMRGFTQLLAQRCAPWLDATGEDYAHRIETATERMDALIGDLLHFGRLGHQKVQWAPVDLNALMDRLVQELTAGEAANHAEIRVDKPLPPVLADARVLEQMIANLVNNGLKFVAPGTQPRLHIWAEESDGTVRLNIQDNGIGIAPEYHERIFGVFERLHEPEAYPGTGIGLAIVKKGAELLGARVQVESQAGQGSRFTLQLRACSPNALNGRASAAAAPVKSGQTQRAA